MKTPSSNALDRALEVLLTDIYGVEAPGGDTPSPSPSCLAGVRSKWAAVSYLKQHIDGLLLELARQTNAIAPINTLPAELMVAILMESEPSDDDSFNEHHALACVQTSWWHLIKTHGCFWSEINFPSPLELVDLHLRRSGETPLRIGISSGRDDGDDLEMFLDAIQPHSHRWRCLDFTGYSLEVVRPYFEVDTPLLEKLDVALLDEPQGSILLNTVGGPKLKEVQLWAAAVPFSDGICSNLTSLLIHTISTDWLTPTSLHHILYSNPNLESLSFHDISLGDIPVRKDELQPPKKPLVLPHLCSLKVWSVYTPLIWFILRTIQINDSGSFLLGCFDEEETEVVGILDEIIAPQRDQQPTILSTALSVPGLRNIEVTLSENRLDIYGASGTTGDVVRVDLRGTNWGPILKERLTRLPFSSPNFRVPIALNYESMPAPGEDGSFSGQLLSDLMPSVTCLILSSGSYQTLSLILELKRSTENGEWLWPRLSKITLGRSLGRQVREERWEIVMRELSDLVDLRKNLPGVELSFTS